MSDLKLRCQNIKLIISDVDGVLTDGSIYISETGHESKRFSVLDGFAAALARKAGLPIALISGRFSEATSLRAKQLHVDKVHQSGVEKIPPFKELCADFHVEAQQVLYIGDGFIDLPAFLLAGVTVAPANAFPELLSAADFVTERRGGEGVWVDAFRWLFRQQGRLDKIMENMAQEVYKCPEMLKYL